MTTQKILNIKLCINLGYGLFIFYVFPDPTIIPILFSGAIIQFLMEFVINKVFRNKAPLFLAIINLLFINCVPIIILLWGFRCTKSAVSFISFLSHPKIYILLLPLWLPNILFVIHAFKCFKNRYKVND